MIALLALLLSGPALARDEAPEEPLAPRVSLSMDSGLKPMGIPIVGLWGGGARIGALFGPVTPFVGGSFTWGQGDDGPQGNDAKRGGGATLWTAQAGARLRVARLSAAETYLVVAAMTSDFSGRATYKDSGYAEKVIAGLNGGIGGFAGGGADARLSRRVSIGVELGAAYTGAVARAVEKFDGEENEETIGGSAMWTYSNLHLTWWVGGGQ